MSFEAAQQTNKLLAHSSIEEQVHYATSTTPARNFQWPPSGPISKSCFFCTAKPHIHVKNVQPKDKPATTVTNWATFQVSDNRLPEISNPLDHHQNSPSGQVLGTNTFVWLIRMTVRPSPLKTEYCTSTASPSQTRDLTQLTHLQQFLIKATLSYST